ncbi:MAG: hypothetical protein ACRCUP_06335 [Mycoplasmatales bacterium]
MKKRIISALILVVIYVTSIFVANNAFNYNVFKDTSLYTIKNNKYTGEKILEILIDEQSTIEGNIYLKMYKNNQLTVYTTDQTLVERPFLYPQKTKYEFLKTLQANEIYLDDFELYIDNSIKKEMVENLNEIGLDSKYIQDNNSFIENYQDQQQNLIVGSGFILFILYSISYFRVKEALREITIRVFDKQSYYKIFIALFKDEFLILSIMSVFILVISIFIATVYDLSIIYVSGPSIVYLGFLFIVYLVNFSFLVSLNPLKILKGKINKGLLFSILSLMKIIALILVVYTAIDFGYNFNQQQKQLDYYNQVDEIKEYKSFSIYSDQNSQFDDGITMKFTDLYNEANKKYNTYIATPEVIYDPNDGKSSMISSFEECGKNCYLIVNQGYFEKIMSLIKMERKLKENSIQMKLIFTTRAQIKKT